MEAAVNPYTMHRRPSAACELECFSRKLRSDKEAVSRAPLAPLPSGKRHPHQYRIRRAALEACRRRLLANLPQVRQVTSFDDLVDRVDTLIRSIAGIGELVVYDTALRIGAHFSFEPTRVDLHAGTRDNARALGFDPQRQTIELIELPPPKWQLSAREAEDALCIYKDQFNGV